MVDGQAFLDEGAPLSATTKATPEVISMNTDGSILSAVKAFFLAYPTMVILGYFFFVLVHILAHKATAGSSPDFAFVALAVQAGMVYFSHFPVVIGVALSDKYDHVNARQQKEQTKGWMKRLWLAHINTIENFPVFAAGFFAALSLNVEASVRVSLSWTYVILRLIYTTIFGFGVTWPRSTCWLSSWLCCMMLYIGHWTGFWYI
mmetsp:Transcript_3962/g.9185  ORF Transcript_3962/g.9185 Transcript_3962/m.9185 type:complete len:204 (+) Transcript_3962:91-702(+)